ncbi:hypothetical protein ACX0HA_14410 [Flavobacterium hauense]
MKKLLLFLLAITLIISCSKDDDSKAPIDETGGDVFRSQIVTVDAGTELKENEYDAIFNGQDIKILKTEENKLSFFVPYTTTLGNQDLIIPALSATIHYTVKDVILDASAEETIEPLLANMDTFKLTLDDSQESADVKSTLESFNNYFENATIDEQTQMAVMYKSNKTLFDAILLTNFSNPGDRITLSDIALITQHSAAVLLAAGGSVAAIFGPTGADKILGVAVAAVGFIKSIQTQVKLQQRNLDTLGLVFEGITGELDRGGNELLFQDNTATTISLDLAEKKLTTTSAAAAKGDLAVYFKDFNRYNYYAAKINVIIETLNKIPFVSFKPIPLEKMTENVQAVNTDVDQTIYDDITFSIDHPNLSLVSVSFLNSGQISLKIKITGSPTQFPIASKLKYTYKDDYTTLSGTISINVEKKNQLIGTWNMESFNNGFLPGQYVSTYGFQMCPNIVTGGYTTLHATVTFTENTFNVTGSDIIVNGNVGKDENCNVIQDDPDTSTTDNYSEDCTYTLSGNTITITTPGEPEPGVETLTFITPDKIKIGGDVFVRQP